MYILRILLAQNLNNKNADKTVLNKTKRNLKHKNYVYVDDNELPPCYAECDSCERLYFNALQCPNCNTINTNILPNFHQDARKTTKVHFKCSLQSAEEEMGTTGTESNNDTQTLVQSIDAQRGMVVDYVSPMEQLSQHLFPSDASLEKFLTRPVLIKSYTWAEGGGIADTFNPWYEYLNAPVIKNKIQNYYTGRMNLHLKVMINASPFYYGAALFTYEPQSGFETGHLVSSDSTYVNGLSQRPHIWIYPQTSQAGEMTLPFIYNKDAVDLTSAAEVQNLGKVAVKTVTVLQNANAVAAADATIRVYAYASDINIGGPTYKAVLQSSDEYGKGPVSGVASAVANISRTMQNIPVIGKFAKATTIGATALSSVASLFGFTDVPVIDNVEPMKNLPFHSLTSGHIGEPVTKLCLDPKNEVTIDNSVTGVKTEDELAISKFVDRYTYIGQANWSASASPDALLWSQRIQPNVYNTSTTAAGPYGNTGVVATPMGHVAQMFRFWRGSVTIKLTAIASKFHRGRYVITWDPCADISANTSYVGTAFTKIVDIAEESEIELTIPYMQPHPFCLSDTYAADLNQPFGTTYKSHVDNYDNGVLTVRVFTQQTSPVATADIQILVAVKGGPDLEFAMPRNLSQRISPFAYQCDVTMDSRTSMNITNESSMVDDSRYLVSFGEPIKSLRLLLRRATLYSADIIPYPTTSSTSLVNYIGIRSVFPISPGFDPNGVHTANKGTSGTAAYNFVNMTPLAYLAQCFKTRRGSIIHHVDMNSGTTADGFLSVTYSTTNRSAGVWNGASVVSSVSTSVSQATSASLGIYDAGSSGTDITTGYVMPTISVSVPHNTPSKYMHTNPAYAVLGTAGDGSDNMTMKLQFTSRDASLAQVLDYVQIGTDFSLGMFINVPIMYVATTDVVPAP